MTTNAAQLTAAIAATLTIAACSGEAPEQVAEPTDATVPATSGPPASTFDHAETTVAETSEDTSGGHVATSTTSTLPPPPTTLPPEMHPVLVVGPETGEITETETAGPGPTTYAQVVDAGVAAGLWDELGGLTRVLDHVVGALPAQYVPGIESVEETELSEMLHRAWDLKESGNHSPDELEPLRRRYELFAPPQELLDEIAQNAANEPTVHGFRQPAAVASCAPIDVDDFDEDAWIEGCYQVLQNTVPGATLRVFYPAWYDGDGALASLPTVALAALTRSTDTFRELGRIGDIDMVFSAVDTVENSDSTLASAWGVKPWNNDVVDRCAITTWLSATGDVDAFEQTVAHEVWHCVQFYDGMDYTGGAQNWWVEGGAEFFSNVVYPRVNDEWTRLGSFDEAIRTPLYQMAYEAWPWWQHLSNEFSPRHVADLHRGMMEAGGSGIELLDGYDETFHDFVADYAAGAVIDQSGANIPRARMFVHVPDVTKNDEGREIELSFENWTTGRFAILYSQELRVLQTDNSTEGLRSMVKREDRSDRAAWKGFFPEVRSKCDSIAYYLGVATDATTDSSNPAEVKVKIDVVEEAACDPCVLGTWSLDLDTFEQMIMSAIDSEGGMPAGTTFEIGGAYYVSMAEENQLLEQRDGLTITSGVAGMGEITATIDSFAEGTYEADGETLTVSDLVETYNEVTLEFGGSYSFPGAIVSGDGTYTCDDDQLRVTVDPYPPVTWNRVDKILTPPDQATDPSTERPDV